MSRGAPLPRNPAHSRTSAPPTLGAVILLLLAAASGGAPALAADDEPVTEADSLLAPVQAAGLDSLRARMDRHGWTSSLTGYVFREPAGDKELHGGDAEVPEDEFRPWQGRPVRHVLVERLNVFTPIPVGAEDPDGGRGARWGDAFHLDTREFVLRGFILQEPGQPLDVRALVDTERLLRQQPYILDASVEIVPVPGSDEVDVVVITRDKWSIGARAKVGSPTHWTLQLYELNLLGRAVQWNNRFDIRTDRVRGERVDYAGSVELENWRGTFTGFRAAYQSRREIESTALGLYRTADLPKVRTVGHAQASWTRTRETDPHRFDTEDLWLGRNVYSRDPGDGGALSRLFVHARSIRTFFQRRPPVKPDSNLVFQDKVLALGALSWSKRAYRKDRLVRGWGRTEDIPVGYRLKLTGGYRWGEFTREPYAGLELRQASFHRHGYVIWLAEAGGFLRDREIYDAALGGAVGWYGHLGHFWGMRLRPTAVIRMASMFRPPERRDISIGDSSGIPGVPDTAVPGRARLAAGSELTAFTRWAPWGFRVALFGGAVAGTVFSAPSTLAVNRWFSVVTLGTRIFNEHLVFDALEISVSFYPSTPTGVEGDPYYFGTTQRLDLPGFDIDPPRIVRVP